MLPIKEKNVEALQYFGTPGITSDCIKATTTLLNSNYNFLSAAIITNNQQHSIIIKEEAGAYFIIKSGFTSGYQGEGPKGLATVLILLSRHQINIEEYVISSRKWSKLTNMTIEQNEIDKILSNHPIRPSRWHDYIYNAGFHDVKNVPLSHLYPASIPLALVDDRIIDLAIEFNKNPDHSLTIAYRRLEEFIRNRSGINEEGVKLFSKVFLSDPRSLTWDCPDEGEIKGRGTLFSSIYMAFRNARMHREQKGYLPAQLREFMLVNELFNLERESMTPLEIEQNHENTLKLTKR